MIHGRPNFCSNGIPVPAAMARLSKSILHCREEMIGNKTRANYFLKICLILSCPGVRGCREKYASGGAIAGLNLAVEKAKELLRNMAVHDEVNKRTAQVPERRRKNDWDIRRPLPDLRKD